MDLKESHTTIRASSSWNTDLPGFNGLYLVELYLGLSQQELVNGQTTSGGVPALWFPRFVDDFPNVDPTYSVRKHFKRYSLLTCFVGGFALATYMTDVGAMGNRDY